MDCQVIVSHSGTRHIIGPQKHPNRFSTLCAFGIREDEALPRSEGTRDCQFCLAELAVIEKQERQEWERRQAAKQFDAISDALAPGEYDGGNPPA